MNYIGMLLILPAAIKSNVFRICFFKHSRMVQLLHEITILSAGKARRYCNACNLFLFIYKPKLPTFHQLFHIIF